MSGNPVEPTPFITNPAGFTIHSRAPHGARGRPGGDASAHAARPGGLGAHAEGLLPLTQTAMLIRGEIAFHDYEGVAVDLDERERLVADLGDKNAMILRNHGTLAVGENVGEASSGSIISSAPARRRSWRCRPARQSQQSAAGLAGDHRRSRARSGCRWRANLLAWPALKRKAYRLDPDFAS